MTNEDIERKCLEYSQAATPSYTNGTFDRYAIAQAFEDGAEWRINSVWHDARERPKCDTFFIYENVIHAFHVDGVFPPEDEVFVWDDYVKDWGLIKWAYVKDLLPTKEE